MANQNLSPSRTNDRTVTFTRFTLPVSTPIHAPQVDVEDVEELGHSMGNLWGHALTPLITAAGTCYSAWGRIAEKRDQVLLITAWRTTEAMETFLLSTEYKTHLEGLRGRGGEGPVTRMVEFRTVEGRGLPFHVYMKRSFVLHRIFFLQPVSDKQRRTLRELRGMVHSFAASDLPYSARPVSGWVRGSQDWKSVFEGEGKAGALGLKMKEGEMVEEAVVCHFWTSQEDEERGKMEVEGGVSGFEERIRALGALVWREEHVELRGLPAN